MAIFIEFQGLSGSGKTALAGKAVQYLKAHGLNVICRGCGNTLLYEYFRKRPPEYGGIKWFILKRFFKGAPHFLSKHLAYMFYNFSLMNLVCRFEARNPQLTEMMHRGIESNYHSEQGKQWALKLISRNFRSLRPFQALSCMIFTCVTGKKQYPGIALYTQVRIILRCRYSKAIN